MEKFNIVKEDPKEILDEIIKEYEDLAGKRLMSAHIERMILQTIAYREQLVRAGINQAYFSQLPQFATGTALDLLGEVYGLERFKDIKAQCIIKFTPKQAVQINKGTKVTDGQRAFVITENINLTDQSKSVVAIAEKPGEEFNNIALGAINQLPDELRELVDATNTSISNSALERETDESFRERIIKAVHSFSTAGSKAAYLHHIKTVSPLIKDAFIDAGDNGLVEIFVLFHNLEDNHNLLNEIKEYLEQDHIKPLCDTVRVQAIEKLDFTITATITTEKHQDKAKIKETALKELNKHLESLKSALNQDVTVSGIIKALKVDGVYEVIVTSPATLKVNAKQVANCTNIDLTIE